MGPVPCVRNCLCCNSEARRGDVYCLKCREEVDALDKMYERDERTAPWPPPGVRASFLASQWLTGIFGVGFLAWVVWLFVVQIANWIGGQ